MEVLSQLFKFHETFPTDSQPVYSLEFFPDHSSKNMSMFLGVDKALAQKKVLMLIDVITAAVEMCGGDVKKLKGEQI